MSRTVLPLITKSSSKYSKNELQSSIKKTNSRDLILKQQFTQEKMSENSTAIQYLKRAFS
jgi:translation initiation factor 2 beta subunit (eIF-2beta)/eIF-5